MTPPDPADRGRGVRAEALAAIAHALHEHQTFLLATHEHADGDGLGSLLALHLGLSARGKRSVALIPDALPARYEFLPGSDLVHTGPPAGDEASAEVAVVLDCDSLSRVAGLRDAVAACPLVINLDHHTNDEPFGDLLLVDPAAAAVGELLYELFTVADWPLDSAIATCLYCAVGTDTGFFRFGNTSPAALRVAAALVEAGADPRDIAERAGTRRSLPAARLLGRALASVQTAVEGRIVAAVLTQSDFAAAGAAAPDTEGIIDQLKVIEAARAALLMREEAPAQWRVSLRAETAGDMAAVARRFGGGGHRAAAGCTIEGDRDQVYAALLAALEPALTGRGR